MFNTESQDQHRLVMALQRLQKYITQLRHIDEYKLRQSIEFLIQGILTPQLVSKTTLRTNLLIIKAHLRQFFQNFHLIFERASDFYAMHNFRFGRHNKCLLIQLQVPLTTFNYDFLVFKVTSFPVPVTGRTTHSTWLLNLPHYFVTSRHSLYYFTMDHDDSTRHPRLLYFPDSNTVFKSFNTASSCISALFRNNNTQILQLCSFSLHEQSLEPNVLFLENGRILLTNISEMTLDCIST